MTKCLLEKTWDRWRLSGGGLLLEIDAGTGTLCALHTMNNGEFVWSSVPGSVSVRDDLLRRTFDARDLASVSYEAGVDGLQIRKSFRDAPWLLVENYTLSAETIHWQAEVRLDKGEFRSCAIEYNIPWPQPLYPVCCWTARDGMPTQPHRHAGIAFEYGEITSGTTMPVLASYLPDKNTGLLLAMPFDFKTARLRFLSCYREPDLRTSFDWLALSPGKPAQTSLLMRATNGHWRPALGWLQERYKEYFEPRSQAIHELWGGHVSGGFDVSREEVDVMVQLGLRWHEVHGHFPNYGNYHPREDVASWRSGHYREDKSPVTTDLVRQTIGNLHAGGAAALLYMQLTGDGANLEMDREFPNDHLRDYAGNVSSAWPSTRLMNSDPSLAFGKDIQRQIDGIVTRYPEMDGIFLDQAGYNFLDTAHHDGITAVNNKPAYMTGFNYSPHLERLSSLLHPHKSIIANAPFGIGIMKYLDGFMAEASGWLCEHLQYYSLQKPMFFLMYESTERDIELMFQRCLIYGAGFTSYPHALASKDLYDRYRPLVQKLYRRRWIFDSEPIQVSGGFQGSVFRSAGNSLVASIVRTEARLEDRGLPAANVRIQTADADEVRQVFALTPDGEEKSISFGREDGALQVDLPGDLVATVLDLKF